MNKAIPTLLIIGFLILATRLSRAGSASWSSNPISGDWNTAANWMPNTVPNGPDDVATFSLSNQTSVSNSSVTEVNSIVFSADASPFAITLNSTSQLTLSGVGVVSSAGMTQNVVGKTDDAGKASVLRFTGNATAGDSTIRYTNEGTPNGQQTPGAAIQFEDNSTAGTAEFINLDSITGFGFGGLIKFTETSTAANGTFTNGGNGGYYATIEFHDQATAGAGTFTNQAGGAWIKFFDSTTADHATFTNKPAFISAVYFYDNSTAANATIINEGSPAYSLNGFTSFQGTSTAGNGLFVANGSFTDYYGYGVVYLEANSSAGNGTFIANGGQVSRAGGGQIILNTNATAENGTFYANGSTVDGAFGGRVIFSFYTPTAARATLIATDGLGTGSDAGGGILFHYSSVGDEARVEVFGNGFLDMRGHDTPELTIGSLEGDGLVFLGNVNLSVGSNNRSTVFSGLIEENSEGVQGALTKIGSGALVLTGANTYTGGTTIEGGNLVVNNRTGSATGSGPVQVNAGGLGGRGTVAGAVIVGEGSGLRAALVPRRRGGKPDTLTIQSQLTFNSDGVYRCKLNTKSGTASKVVANGVIINAAQFSLLDCCGLLLSPGTVLTVIDNTSANPISGTFSNLADGAVLTVNGNNFQADYEGGDGNDLTLTVIP
jgi:autotransporter-associated beta strand protein